MGAGRHQQLHPGGVLWRKHHGRSGRDALFHGGKFEVPKRLTAPQNVKLADLTSMSVLFCYAGLRAHWPGLLRNAHGLLRRQPDKSKFLRQAVEEVAQEGAKTAQSAPQGRTGGLVVAQ